MSFYCCDETLDFPESSTANFIFKKMLSSPHFRISEVFGNNPHRWLQLEDVDLELDK